MPKEGLSLMSAYTRTGQGPGPNHEYDPVLSAPTGSGGGEGDGLEQFIQSTRKLKQALAHERAHAQKIEKELRDTHLQYGNLLSETKHQNRELELQSGKLKTAFQALQFKERNLLEKGRAISAELSQYKKAWSDVLQRERDAKSVLGESEQKSRSLSEAESRNRTLTQSLTEEKSRREQLERHAHSYQLELQNTLVRLHSAEAKFSEISKEMQAVQQARKSHSDEVARVEQTIKERYQWELVREREKLKAELEKDLTYERDRIKEALRLQIRAEMAKQWETDKQELGAEINRTRLAANQAIEALHAAKQETEQAGKLLESERSKAEAEQGVRRGLEASAVALRKKLDETIVQLRDEKNSAEDARRAAQTQAAQLEAKLTREIWAKLESEFEAKLQDGIDRELKTRLEPKLQAEQTRTAQETERAQAVEAILMGEKLRFDETTRALSAELDRLRSIDTMRELIRGKESEITRLQRELTTIPAGKSRRSKVEDALEAHQDQLGRLRCVVAESEERMAVLQAQIQLALGANTIMAEAP